VAGVPLEHLLEEEGQAREGRVGLDAAPRAPAAAGQRRMPSSCRGAGMWAASIPARVSPSRGARWGRCRRSRGRSPGPAGGPRPSCPRARASPRRPRRTCRRCRPRAGSRGPRPRPAPGCSPRGSSSRRSWRAGWPRGRGPRSAGRGPGSRGRRRAPGPRWLVLGEEAHHALDPALDHGRGAHLGVRGALQELHGDHRAVGPDASGLGGRGAAVGSDVNVLVWVIPGWGRITTSPRNNCKSAGSESAIWETVCHWACHGP
jgi:hypothetical protein